VSVGEFEVEIFGLDALPDEDPAVLQNLLAHGIAAPHSNDLIRGPSRQFNVRLAWTRTGNPLGTPTPALQTLVAWLTNAPPSGSVSRRCGDKPDCM
jgi:hypothetical protein